MSCDFGSVCRMVTSDFWAMIAYKYRLFQKCFRLCESEIALLLHADTKFIDVFNETRFDLYLMADDHLSFMGLSVIFNGNSQTC